MKRILISIVLVAVLASGAAVAQDSPFENFDDFTSGFEAFGRELAGALPHNTTIGQQWADAHIGQLLAFPPRFGLGVSVGQTTIPRDAFDQAFNSLGLDSQELLSDLPEEAQELGLPLPGFTVDARAGGIILPFDVGVKVGALDEFPIGEENGPTIDYLLAGADVRYRVVRERRLLPKVSVGAGVNYSTFRLDAPGLLGESVDIADVPDDPDDPDSTATLGFTDPELFLEWETTVFDITAQASKRFFIFQPFVGAGLSYSSSDVGGGVSSQFRVNGSEPTEEELETIQEALAASGEDGEFSFADNQFGFLATQEDVVNTRVFGGLGLRLFMFNLDVGASYEFESGSIGAQIGTRIQF
ncbi:MAG: hypothetical protein ACOC4I_04010 [Spirochaetota bacterium]